MYKTSNGPRPDLRDQQVPGLENLIAPVVLPVLKVRNKTGRIYYRDLVTKAKPSTSKRTDDTAPETTFLNSTYIDFSCSPIEKRYGINYDEVENYGGIEAADLAGGEGAKTSIAEQIERNVAKFILGGSTTTAAGDTLIDKVEAAKVKVKRFAGRLAVVMSDAAFQKAMTYPDVVARLRMFRAVTPADNAQVLALKKTLLAMVLEVDDIIIGDDEYWAETVESTDLSARLAVLKIAPSDDNSIKLKPVFARLITYFPDDSSPYEVTSFPDDNVKANKYDGTAWNQTAAFNSAACQVISGLEKKPVEPIGVTVSGTVTTKAEAGA